MRTDEQLLDGLQRLVTKSIRNVCGRWSPTERGWRLHQTSRFDGGSRDVRFEIEKILDEEKEQS